MSWRPTSYSGRDDSTTYYRHSDHNFSPTSAVPIARRAGGVVDISNSSLLPAPRCSLQRRCVIECRLFRLGVPHPRDVLQTWAGGKRSPPPWSFSSVMEMARPLRHPPWPSDTTLQRLTVTGGSPVIDVTGSTRPPLMPRFHAPSRTVPFTEETTSQKTSTSRSWDAPRTSPSTPRQPTIDVRPRKRSSGLHELHDSG